MNLTDIQEGKLIVHNDFLKSYLPITTIKNLRHRNQVVLVNKSYVLYESVLSCYAKNAEMLGKLPTKESLLAEIEKRIAESKAISHKVTELSSQNDENKTTNEVKALFERAKKAEYADILSFYTKKVGKTNKAAELANLAIVFQILASVKGKNSVKSLGIAGVESKEDLATKLYELGAKQGFISMKQGWFEIKACEFKKAINSPPTPEGGVITSKTPPSGVGGLATLIHGNEKNVNAGKLVNNELAKLVLLSMWVNKDSDIKNSEAWIVRSYNELAKGNSQFVDTMTGELIGSPPTPEGGDLTTKTPPLGGGGLPVLSENTIRNFLAIPYNQAVFSKYRHGSKYYKDSFRPYVLGVMPQYALSMCSLDGFTMPFVRKRDNTKQSSFTRFKVVFVFDVATQAITGYSWGLSEGRDVFVGAINMMLRKYGRIPMEIQQDNAARFLKNEFLVPSPPTPEGGETPLPFGEGQGVGLDVFTPPLGGGGLESIFPFVTFPEPYNAQAKPVERYLGMFDEEILRNQKGWMGKNIKGTKSVESMRNPDYVPYAYTDKEFAECLEQWVNEWNNGLKKNGKSRIDNFLSTINPESKEISSEILYGFCAEMTERQIKNGFVTVEYNYQEYKYLIEDYEYVLASIKYNRVRVRFIPEKLNNEVAIYAMTDEDDSSQDRFICICKSAARVQRSKAEQEEIDRKELSVYTARKKHFDKVVEEQNEKLLQLRKQSLNSFESDLKTENEEYEEMTEDEAETILQSGYTEKSLMERAEERLDSKQLSKEQLSKKQLDMLKMLR